MKKLLAVLVSVLMVLTLAACAGNGGNEPAADDKTIDTLTISFVPSKDADVILTAAEPLKDLLKTKLAEKGYTVNNVDISVGTDYSASGEGMISGSIDIGFLPASTYVLYHEDGANLLVEALRYGVGDADGKVIDPKEGIAPWNAGITTDAKDMVTGYASLIYVNIATEKGAALYDKAVNGTLTWEDVDSATWYVCSSTSSAGYVYPSLWLNNNFGEGAGSTKKTVADLSNVIPDGSYSNMMNALLTGQVDVTVGYADVRKDAASTENFEAAYKDEIAAGTYANVWDIIKVIAVSDYIMNDTICVADEKVDPKMTPDFVKALQDTFIELGQTEEGLACVAPYSHKGYQLGQDSDYDATRAANALFQ
ncbi:MAG: PhnD/SsuA/transferrin family substrate-binding protein [Erysipelotrichaceae bacterium]|nr:PhnD/SsuA/transferrin family substrate-binding protein [Erysipelotrichaceae bacterium]